MKTIKDLFCYIFGHKITPHITQPNDMKIEYCDRCGKYESFINNPDALRAFDL